MLGEGRRGKCRSSERAFQSSPGLNYKIYFFKKTFNWNPTPPPLAPPPFFFFFAFFLFVFPFLLCLFACFVLLRSLVLDSRCWLLFHCSWFLKARQFLHELELSNNWDFQSKSINETTLKNDYVFCIWFTFISF